LTIRKEEGEERRNKYRQRQLKGGLKRNKERERRVRDVKCGWTPRWNGRSGGKGHLIY